MQPVWVERAHAHLLGADSVMAALVRRQGVVARPVCRQWQEFYGRLARAIIGQQISTTAAASIYRRVAERAQRGDEPLRPEDVHARSDEELRACGLSAAKLASIRDLTARALDGRLDLERLACAADAEVQAQLVAVRGIGRWTAEMFLMFALGRPDVLSTGDLGIQNAIQRLYHLEARPTATVVQGLAAGGGWHPFATAACFHLWESLATRPPAEQAGGAG